MALDVESTYDTREAGKHFPREVFLQFFFYFCYIVCQRMFLRNSHHRMNVLTIHCFEENLVLVVSASNCEHLCLT